MELDELKVGKIEAKEIVLRSGPYSITIQASQSESNPGVAIWVVGKNGRQIQMQAGFESESPYFGAHTGRVSSMHDLAFIADEGGLKLQLAASNSNYEASVPVEKLLDILRGQE